MVKKYVLTFSISVLILFSLCIILLMLMVPQQQTSLNGSLTEYEQINTQEYTFVPTKDISQESLIKEYRITATEISSFEKYNQYKAGNSNPFTPTSDITDSTNNNNQNNADNNTDNSNGGVSNPPSTNK